MTKKYLNTYWNETRLDCGIRHRTLDRGTTLYKGQNDKEEAQHIQYLKINATIEMNAGGKLVKIKEERGLLQDWSSYQEVDHSLI